MPMRRSAETRRLVVANSRERPKLSPHAARTAGARGGTIIHAKGTGTEFTAKFFGVSIASEKDIALIVVSHKDKDAIMRAIMEKAGIRSEAHTALVSLPAENVVGLTSVMTQDMEE